MQTSVQTQQQKVAGIRPLTADEVDVIGGGAVNPWVVRLIAKAIIWIGSQDWKGGRGPERPL